LIEKFSVVADRDQLLPDVVRHDYVRRDDLDLADAVSLRDVLGDGGEVIVAARPSSPGARTVT
jgi:hypothetical protein